MQRTLIIALTALAALTCAASAMASHEKGGFLSTNITADGHLQGTVVYMQKGTCVVGTTYPGGYGITVAQPDSGTQSIPISFTYSRCLANLAEMRATFDVDLATWGGQQAGDYVSSFSSCCRISGIKNVGGNGTTFESKVRSIAGTATGAPRLDSNVATGIGVGYEYRQNLNATDPDGGSLTYVSQAGTAAGPTSDIVTYEPNGDVVIPASTTATLADGDNYVYKVRVVDAQGDYSERDVLLTATTQNHPPAFHDLPQAGDDVVVKPGTTVTISFSATDVDTADVVTISSTNLPSYITFTQTPGNPASGTLTISPPAGTPNQGVGINLDATDDNGAVLTASTNLQIKVGVPPNTTIDSAPSASTSDTTPTFAFSADLSPSTFECRVDGGAWESCSSPYDAATLVDGPHTFDVRAMSEGLKEPEPATASFTVDTATPARPVIVDGPSSTTTSTTGAYTFTGEPGGTFECRIDGGAWSPCAGTATYASLAVGKHVFEVRQIDAAGNISEAVSYEHTVVAPEAQPTPPAAPAATEVKLNVAARATVQHNTVQAGCAVDRGSLQSCGVKMYASIRDTRGRVRRVLVGSGSVTLAAPGETTEAVQVKLNARGRTLLARTPGGLKVTLETTARAFDAAKPLTVRSKAVMLPQRQVIVPTDGLFAFDSARLLPAGARYVRAIAPQLRGAKSVTCIGHTDAAGRAGYNRALGLARARTVCRALVKAAALRGVRIVARSAGESHPRATNGTAQGRALNRRVSLQVQYR